MTPIITTIIICLIVFAIVRIVFNSSKGIVYSPDDEDSKKQIISAKQCLKEKWNIEPPTFWIPLVGNISTNVCYFNLDEFDRNFGLIKLSDFINRLEKRKIYSFEESKVFSQIDKLYLEKYSGLDAFYTNFSAQWVIYITHENTIAFGGLAIIETLLIECPELNKYINPGEKKETNSLI